MPRYSSALLERLQRELNSKYNDPEERSRIYEQIEKHILHDEEVEPWNGNWKSETEKHFETKVEGVSKREKVYEDAINSQTKLIGDLRDEIRELKKAIDEHSKEKIELNKTIKRLKKEYHDLKTRGIIL